MKVHPIPNRERANSRAGLSVIGRALKGVPPVPSVDGVKGFQPSRLRPVLNHQARNSGHVVQVCGD